MVSFMALVSLGKVANRNFESASSSPITRGLSPPHYGAGRLLPRIRRAKRLPPTTTGEYYRRGFLGGDVC